MRLALMIVTGLAIGFTARLMFVDPLPAGQILIGMAISVWGVLLVVGEAQSRR